MVIILSTLLIPPLMLMSSVEVTDAANTHRLAENPTGLYTLSCFGTVSTQVWNESRKRKRVRLEGGM